MTTSTASNGVFRESERLCPIRTVASVTRKNNDPSERNLNEGQVPRVDTEAQQGFEGVPECIHG
jgi:hypothetical protein